MTEILWYSEKRVMDTDRATAAIGHARDAAGRCLTVAGPVNTAQILQLVPQIPNPGLS